MAKRETVDVDEEHLKEIMAGGVSRLKKEQPTPEAKRPSESEDSEQSTEAKEPAKPVRKKREAQDYEILFLERKASTARRQIYVSSQLCDKINSFLPVIAGHQLGITTYVNNILTHHLELYKDDINELYERKSKKPL
jgi:hypothetical protein